jgi:2-oxoglutarate ferredoxin oxidoreductase subunit beta
VLRLRKLHDAHDPTDRVAALNHLARHKAMGEIVTGLLYLDPEPEDLHDHLGTVATPLNLLDDTALCPGQAALEKINAALR